MSSSSVTDTFVAMDVVFQNQGVWKPLLEIPLETQNQQIKTCHVKQKMTFLNIFLFFFTFPQEKIPHRIQPEPHSSHPTLLP